MLADLLLERVSPAYVPLVIEAAHETRTVGAAKAGTEVRHVTTTNVERYARAQEPDIRDPSR